MSLPSRSLSPPSSLDWTARPGRELLRLAWPITVSMVSFSMMTLTSTAFVAHLGADELAGVGLAGVVGFTLVCFGIGLLRAAKTLVSQAVGADRRDRLPELFGAALGLAVALGSDLAGRLGVCDAPGCDRVYVDASRNGGRRFCSTRCQNRVKAAAHRRRRDDERPPPRGTASV